MNTTVTNCNQSTLRKVCPIGANSVCVGSVHCVQPAISNIISVLMEVFCIPALAPPEAQYSGQTCAHSSTKLLRYNQF